MKWVRKKTISNSSSGPSLFNHVFSSSWLKKLKIKPGETKAKQKGKLDRVASLTNSPRSANWREGRFCSGNDDLYWRLSFGVEGFGGETSTRGVRSIWSDSDDDLDVPMSSCINSSISRTRAEDGQRFKDMVSDTSKMGVMEYNTGFMLEKDDKKSAKVRQAKPKAPKEKAVSDQDQIRLNQSVPTERKAEMKRRSFKAEEQVIQMRDDFQKPRVFNSRRQRSLSCPGHNLTTIGKDFISQSEELQQGYTIPEDECSPEWKKLNSMRMKPKNERRRKSVYLRRGNLIKRQRVNTRIKACSPRTAAKNEYKIVALDDVKRAKKTRNKEGGVKSCAKALNSHAVMKSSFDPQQDFRDSMLEMIIQKGIRHPKELEQLLVCYLMLNRSEYHDLIIKVFRQLWFELNQQVYLDPKLHKECSYHH